MGRFCIACGGTGGHLFPGLALAQVLQERGHAVRLYISQKPVDARVLADYPQFEAVKLPVIGWQGFNLRLVRFLCAFFKSYSICMRDMKSFAPNAVMGMGGFCSAPPLLAAWRKKILSYLHESNVIPGRVTRYLAPKMSKVFLGFKESREYLPQVNCEVVGTPINRLVARMPRHQAAAILGLDSVKKTLAVMGGSQGAISLNTWVMQSIEKIQIPWQQWQVVHLTGPGDRQRVQAFYQDKKITAHVVEFSNQMSAVYSLSDLIISRCGASSLAEISAFGLASVLIPFPYATDDHQTANGEVFVKNGASVLLHEDRGENLHKVLQELIEDEPKRAQMEVAAHALHHEDVVEKIVKELTHATA